MENKLFDVLLLLALPASGKSEVRNFMANIDAQILEKEFHIGPNLQLDDFPYVHLMRRIDDTLAQLGQERIYYPGNNPFIDGRDWGTLIHLLNEDYYDMVNKNVVKPESAAKFLFQRLENASLKAGFTARLSLVAKEIMDQVANILEAECQDLLNEKHAGYPVDNMNGKTVVIEMSRGGSDGSIAPLNDPFGYQYSLRLLAPEILERATILYIWVTPEESRRKNFERTDPNNPGSILNHGVPLSVMLGDYGMDDMHYLIENSEIKNTVTVKAYGKTYHLPIGVFDNRNDKTTFLRQPKENWPKDKVETVTEGIKTATDAMYENYSK